MSDLCFQNISSNPTSHWLAIRKFISVWHDFNFKHSARYDTELVNAEELICGPIPTSMREWIRLCCELLDQNKEGCFRDYFVIERVPGHDAIGFLLQCEGDVYWAVQLKDMNLDNPPITTYLLDYDASSKKFDHFNQNTSCFTEFVLTHLSHFIYPKGGSFSVQVSNSEVIKEQLKQYFDVSVSVGHLHIYESNGKVFFLFPDDFDEGVLQLHGNLKRKATAIDLPDFIIELTHDGGCFTGPFADSI